MYYLAFDVSKAKLDVILTNLRNKTDYFQINNTESDIKDWLCNAKLPKRIIAGSESTANYHLLVQKILVENGYDFKLINPILTKQFIKTTIRKRKTDKNDSLIIAKLLAQGEGQLIKENDLDIKVKIQQRILGKLISQKQRYCLMKKSLELHDNIPKFVNETLEDLEHHLNERVNNYLEILKRKHSSNEVIQLLTSIPGIGFKLALIIYSEIGDIARFNHPKRLVAFAGLDPKIRRSGKVINSTGKLTKRGSPRLRYAIFVAANIARMHDPDLKAYYEKKRQEGKRHTVATVATSRKLINRIFIVWSEKRPYIAKKIEC